MINTGSFEAGTLIVIPPFAGLDRPALGAHILQACARERNHDVDIVYGNMLLANRVGEDHYSAICFASTSNLLGERFFSRAAYGIPIVDSDGKPISSTGGEKTAPKKNSKSDRNKPSMGWQKFAELAENAELWSDDLAKWIVEKSYKVVGCTTTFEQTAASIALLNRVKELSPETIIVMGGANCEGEMAKGICSLSPNIDYVFSGECEDSFPTFLDAVEAGDLPGNRIISGKPTLTMDNVATPDYSEYYAQFAELLADSKLKESGNIWLPYESSRGCWWGEKSHCTFCGINGEGMGFREKSPDKVMSELSRLMEKHPTNRVCMTDNIMPYTYFKNLLPRLEESDLDLHLFYEQKANLSLDRVRMLKSAKVAVIQPGIEALSTPLLKLMKKGVTASQNIALLRYSRIADMAVNWNLLYAFPEDKLAWYEDVAAIMPALVHLNPPTSLCHLSVDRFSPYFEKPAENFVRSVKPMRSYFDVLPKDVDHKQIAYHFEGDYNSESKGNKAIVKKLESGIESWRKAWEPEKGRLPALEIAPISNDMFILMDTRGLDDCLEVEFINQNQASMALAGKSVTFEDGVAEWAIERKVCLEIDNKLTPLATAAPSVVKEFERYHRLWDKKNKKPAISDIKIEITCDA